jgi:predicted  nucleic acid-binding Zn-ribbon protein
VDNIRGQVDLEGDHQGQMTDGILERLHALEKKADNKEVRIVALEHENQLLEKRVETLEEKNKKMWEKMVNMHHDLVQVR